MAYNNELWEPGLTLYDAIHLRGVLSIPHKLRKVSFIQESGGGTLGTPYFMNSDFVQALAYSQSDPTFVDL
ncbi:hypothetical protein EV122DRAFT_283486 [Schizophyllum commune]